MVRGVLHCTWLANPMVVQKANGKWRLCIDFTNLNKACPKDPFPLSCIDQIVDSTSRCDLLSFLDAYSGYHQIFMSMEDEEKTSFITPCGTYCFIRMPFGLKSVGSMFARAVQIGFEPQLHRNIEAYMDDIVVKTRTKQLLSRIWRHLQICARSTSSLTPRSACLAFPPASCLGTLCPAGGSKLIPTRSRPLSRSKRQG